MPLQATSGAASYDAFGGGVAAVPNYIEDVFSTFLYQGNGSTQTINNGIDLAGKGGLVWTKVRPIAGFHVLNDTVRGVGQTIYTNLAVGQNFESGGITAFNSNGYTTGSQPYWNENNQTFVSWTFREQPKFFDVVTYTGNGALPNQLISHNLGSVPGCIIIKATNASGNWIVWHRGNGTTNYTGFSLNLTSASAASVASGDLPTATQFKPAAFFDPDYNGANSTGVTYVAYLFAHNAGGFGLTGTDNVITCGSFTTDGSGNATVSLGYEPQWILFKSTTLTDSWYIVDSMRGWPVTTASTQILRPNTSGAETTGTFGNPTATGFTLANGGANQGYIYVTIRRGPMRTPTTGTSVFAPIASSAATGTAQTTNFPVDMQWLRSRAADATYVIDRLRGISTTPTTASSRTIYTNDTFAEGGTNTSNGWNNTGFSIPSQQGGTSSIYWSFRRAPGFFDEVCYTGTGSARTVAHNLAAVPQLMLVKQRTASPVGTPFAVYSATMGNTGIMFLNSDGGNQGPDTQWNSTTPTASVFSVGSNLEVNQSGSTFVAYLFASCPGVSRVGSYTGTGTTQVINCGFTAGSRFVMIKRVGTGDWYVWDSARGIVAGNDPYLLLNSTAAEVTNTDFVDTAATGFEISSTAPAAINASGGTFIFLAIA